LPGVPTPTGAAAPSGNLSTFAGFAWLASAALTAFLAYQQWSFSVEFPSSDLASTAVWNGVTAAITLFFAARLIGTPSRSILDWSIVWALISVVSGVYQVATAEGVGDVFVLSVIAAATAGVLSFVARQGGSAA
jgi:hypothetical protein